MVIVVGNGHGDTSYPGHPLCGGLTPQQRCIQSEGDRGVMVIVVGHGNTSSNPGRD